MPPRSRTFAAERVAEADSDEHDAEALDAHAAADEAAVELLAAQQRVESLERELRAVRERRDPRDGDGTGLRCRQEKCRVAFHLRQIAMASTKKAQDGERLRAVAHTPRSR